MGKTSSKRASGYLEKLVGMIFPPRCIFCGSMLEAGCRIQTCDTCYEKIPFSSGELIRPGKRRDGGCDFAVGICRYTGIVKDSIKRFKFFNKPGYYRTFAGILADRLQDTLDTGSFDIITSVPLYRHRQHSRGYNQAALLSDELSRKTGVPDCPNLLVRVRDTGVQSLLPGNERELNVKDAFKVKDVSKVRGKAVLLVDDVLTTGSTVDECSRVLKEAGAVVVGAVVVAAGRKY